jgi:hypothetical protein
LNGKYNKSSLNKLKKFKESPEGTPIGIAKLIFHRVKIPYAQE